jgi:hypothetical protein
MIRILRYLPLLLSAALLQAEEVPAKEEQAAPVEASADIRKSLAGDARMKLNEGFPDPVKYPKLHQEARSEADENHFIETIGGYDFYGSTDSLVQDFLDPIRKTLSNEASFEPLEKLDRAFHPDHAVTWTIDGESRHSLISLKSKEVAFVDQDRQLRYRLTDTAHSTLCNEFKFQRRHRPDALEEAERFLKPLRDGAEITVIQGFPRGRGGPPPEPGDESFEAEEARRGKVVIGGYEFFKSGTLKPESKPLREAILKDGTLQTWGGGKACGGFHPDFAIMWKADNADAMLLVCFGCHEAMFLTNSGFLLYDLGKGYDAVKAELARYSARPLREAR